MRGRLTERTVGKLGYYLPWALVSSVLAAIGAGLLGTLGVDAPTGKWVGFQILAGVGRGFGMQMVRRCIFSLSRSLSFISRTCVRRRKVAYNAPTQPILAMQAKVKPKEVAVGQALLTFSQSIGIAIFVVVGNTIFDDLLRSGLPKYAPGANAAAIIAAGATGFRSFTTPAELPGVLTAYAKAVTAPLYLAAAAAALAFFSAWGMGWVDIRKKKKTPPNTDV